MTRGDLIRGSIIRYTADEIIKMYDSKREVLKEMNQCEVCGCMYEKDKGLDNYEDDNYEYGHTCLECIKLLETGLPVDNIPYDDEFFKAKFNLIDKDIVENYYFI